MWGRWWGCGLHYYKYYFLFCLHCPLAFSLCLRFFRKIILCSMTSCAAFILLESGVGLGKCGWCQSFGFLARGIDWFEDGKGEGVDYLWERVCLRFSLGFSVLSVQLMQSFQIGILLLTVSVDVVEDLYLRWFLYG